MRYILRHLLLAMAICGLLIQTASAVFAQNPTGSIRGTVTDEQGAVVPKATITVTSKATGVVRKATTNDEGIYTVENLLPGDYDLKVEATGFSTASESVTVLVGNTV